MILARLVQAFCIGLILYAAWTGAVTYDTLIISVVVLGAAEVLGGLVGERLGEVQKSLNAAIYVFLDEDEEIVEEDK